MDIKQIYTRVRPQSSSATSFIRDYYDLLLLGGASLLLPGILLFPIPVVRVPLGLTIVLFMPGYAFTAALFPYRSDIDGVSRAALSSGLSLAVLPVLALIIDALPWGIRPWPIALSLAFWMLLCTSIALQRRRKLLPSDNVYTPPILNLVPLSTKLLDRHLGKSKIVARVLMISFLVLLAVTMSISKKLPSEFYVLGKTGQAEDYPRQVKVNQSVTVTMGIVNSEQTSNTYRIEVWALDRWDEHRKVLLMSDTSITVSAGQTYEWASSWQMPWVGNDQRVDVYLFKDEQSLPFRTLRLWVDVVAEG